MNGSTSPPRPLANIQPHIMLYRYASAVVVVKPQCSGVYLALRKLNRSL